MEYLRETLHVDSKPYKIAETATRKEHPWSVITPTLLKNWKMFKGEQCISYVLIQYLHYTIPFS